MTLGDTHLRTRTGASVVAVSRAGQVIPSPGPDFELVGRRRPWWWWGTTRRVGSGPPRIVSEG